MKSAMKCTTKNSIILRNLFWACFVLVAKNDLIAGSIFPAIPEEYESTGGQSLAFGGSVATAVGGTSAVRANPALLALEKEYTVNGSYHWPTAGRDFYQLGVVDGKTSGVAAGFAYTGALDNYQGITSNTDSSSVDIKSAGISKDSPIIRRGNLAFAMAVGKIFIGAGGGYVEARPPEDAITEDSAQKVKGFTFGFGAAAHISEALRIGFSAENLANKKIQYAAPTFYRAGATYFWSDLATLSLDYRRREAISVYEGSAPSFSLVGDSTGSSSPIKAENMINTSTSVKVYDLLRFIAGVGQISSPRHSVNQLSAGLALVNQKFNFSYQILRPNLSSEAIHHALSLGLDIAM